ncbi:MAG: sulfatase [Deltaproteobacteria bacterium]|nr:sulfatase [Deltaproteobacteria bacterium]
MLLWALCGWALAREPDLILISMDTTRADALSCDGPAPGGLGDLPVTPVLDQLAAEGLRFTHLYSHVPSTLSAHTSMMTGMDPHQHGVPRNGFPVDPTLPTLAERLSAAGWESRAVIGSKALEQSMGLDRGFLSYDDRAEELHGIMYQARAEDVVARAVEAMDAANPAKPLFLFVHFYDPHTPYDPPEPWRSRLTDPSYQGPFTGGAFSLEGVHQPLLDGTLPPAEVAQIVGLYLGEVAYVDAQIGRLLDALRERGRLERALVVVTADHGETLAEDPDQAFSHGARVTRETTRVPLVMRGYGVPLAERAVVDRQAALSGLPATLEIALGLEPTLGADLWDLVRPGPVRLDEGWPERPVRTVFQEATRPRQREDSVRWNNLPMDRGVRAGGWVAGWIPYRDPALALREGGEDLAVLPVLDRMLRRWDADAPPHRDAAMPDATRQALEALGYLEPERSPPAGSQ